MTKTWLQSEIDFRKNFFADNHSIITREEAKSKGLQAAFAGFLHRTWKMDLVKITLLNGQEIETNLGDLSQFEDDSDEWSSMWHIHNDYSNSDLWVYERAIASIEFFHDTDESIQLKIDLAKKLGIYEN